MTNRRGTFVAFALLICFLATSACVQQDKRCKKNAKKIKEFRKNNPNFTM